MLFSNRMFFTSGVCEVVWLSYMAHSVASFCPSVNPYPRAKDNSKVKCKIALQNPEKCKRLHSQDFARGR